MRTTTILRVLSHSGGHRQIRHYSTLPALPFKVERKSANEQFATLSQGFLEANAPVLSDSTAVQAYKSDPVKECFVPFHSADLRGVRSIYAGQYGIDRIEYYWETVTDKEGSRVEQRTRTVTDWHRCSGTTSPKNYPFGTISTQIYAGFDFPSVLIERVLPCQDVIYAKPLTDEMVGQGGNKKIVYSHQMNMSNALLKLNSKLYEMERKRARKAIIRQHKADHSNIESLDVLLNEAEINLFSYYIPAYIYESEMSNLFSYKIVNGYNGETYGNKIYSIIKSAMLGATLGGVATWGLAILGQPYLLPLQIIVRILIGASTSGAFSGLIARSYNRYHNFHYINDKIKEANENANFPESDDDIARREFAAKFDQSANDTSGKNKLKLPKDKCELFGLNPEKEVTIEMLKTAYHHKMKKWHPDLFREKHSKEMAEAMTKELNQSYRTLTDLLQPGKRA